ncbi:MAG TPA: TolC family protein, partial [Pyrinomonadaceae bacterium]|nr:TolC family protein [Pyrinomonadaceae bacterium]
MSHKKAQKVLLIFLCLFVACVDVLPQRKTKKKPAPAPPTELTKLREEFVKATSEYKASLTKLLTIYENNVKKAEEKLELSRKLLAEGLISRLQVEENERALAADKAKVEETRRQMTNADAQVAGIFAETAAEQQLAKNLRLARQSLVRTASFTRYTGAPGWGLSEAW